MKTLKLISCTLLAASLGTLGCKGEIGIAADDPESYTTSRGESNEPVVDETPRVTPNDDTATPEASPSAPVLKAGLELADLTNEQVLFYLRTISQMLVARPLSFEEVQEVERAGHEAIRPILESWVGEPAFAESAKYMMQQKLKASGDRDGIDFEAPGRIVEHTVANRLPFSTIITADYCIGPDGSQTDCDSGAPYNAGVMTTRAFLAGNASRFNLGRASRMMKVFACRAYPMEDTLQPRLPKEDLIPMFRAMSPDEQTVEEAKDAFGNGSACYTCHGQFSAHSQFYVKFDEEGRYVADATGLQDPEGELGRSVNGLMTSHMDDPLEAAFEGSKMFGRDADNLREAAAIMSESNVFVPCMVRNVLEYTFGMTDSAATDIDRRLLNAVASRTGEDPTLDKIVVETFTDARVVEVVMESRGGTQ